MSQNPFKPAEVSNETTTAEPPLPLRSAILNVVGMAFFFVFVTGAISVTVLPP